MSRTALTIFAMSIAFSGLLLVGKAGYIHAKAILAQYLIADAWHQLQHTGMPGKPWPWADTRAVAILEVPRLRLREIVLEGSSGRNLAFGPTLVNPTRLDETADRILSGHRDTHFNFVKNLQTGDLLRLRTTKETRDYRVSWQETVDSRQQQLVIDDNVERLTLLTCYPFDATTRGGPLRHLVTAVPSP